MNRMPARVGIDVPAEAAAERARRATGAAVSAVEPAPSPPDPEVPAKAQRRRFSVEYRLTRMPPMTMNEARRIERSYDTRRPPAGDVVPREAGRAVVGAGPHGSPHARGCTALLAGAPCARP